MTVKNFVFRNNWVGSEVASMKIALLPFLTRLGPTFWPQQVMGFMGFMGFLKQNFNFQSLRMTEAI